MLLDQFYIFECLKGFIIAMWPKNCPKLSKDGKLTIKKDVHLVLPSSNFSGPFYQVSRQFANIFSWKYITCNSVWLCWNIFEILKLVSVFSRNILWVFWKKTLQKRVKSRVGDWNWRPKLASMGGHLGFTFHWPVSIPDMEIEFTGRRTPTVNLKTMRACATL